MSGFFGPTTAPQVGRAGFFGQEPAPAPPSGLAMIASGIMFASEFTGYGGTQPFDPFFGLTPGASLTPDTFNGARIASIICDTGLGLFGGLQLWIEGLHPQNFFTNLQITINTVIGTWINRTSASADSYQQDLNDPPPHNWTIWRFNANNVGPDPFAPFTLGGAYTVNIT